MVAGWHDYFDSACEWLGIRHFASLVYTSGVIVSRESELANCIACPLRDQWVYIGGADESPTERRDLMGRHH